MAFPGADYIRDRRSMPADIIDTNHICIIFTNLARVRMAFMQPGSVSLSDSLAQAVVEVRNSVAC